MRRYVVPLVVGVWLCGAPLVSVGRVAPGQRTGMPLTGPGSTSHEEIARKLLRLAVRSGVTKEVQTVIREGVEAWSHGDPQPLGEIQVLLESEEGRSQRSKLSRRQAGRVRLLRDAIRRLCGEEEGPENRAAAVGETGGIQGRVTEADSGLPIDFEFVEVYDALGEYVDQDLTDEGEYAVDGLDPGTYFVLTDTEDYFDELYDDLPCPNGACDITSGKALSVMEGANVTGIDFELRNGGRILGLVTDAGSGLPLSSESIEVFDALGDGVAVDFTDSSGSYLVGGLPSGTYTVLAAARDHLDELYDDIPCPLEVCDKTSGTPLAVTFGQDTVGVDFVLDTGGRILGQLSEQRTGLALGFEFVRLYSALGDVVGFGLTDTGGNYLIGGLPAGTYFATTDTFGDYLDELYDDLPCANQSCDPTAGTAIQVGGTSDTAGIDFVLANDSGGSADCIPDSRTLCIDSQPDDQRFKVTVHFSTLLGGGAEGDARAQPLKGLGIPRGGIFSFTDPGNPEVLVKVLNGCSITDHHWVFYAATTTVGFVLTVEDTVAATTRTYTNIDQTPAETITDTRAFATCP